jgi:hypothetical protein
MANLRPFGQSIREVSRFRTCGPNRDSRSEIEDVV